MKTPPLKISRLAKEWSIIRPSLQSALLLIALSAPCQLLAQNPQLKIDSLMHKAHQLGIFNGNILVSKAGRVIYRKSFGHADASRTRPLDPDMLFDVGSISKEFNGVAILLLQQMGKLSVEDPVRKFLPELPPWAEEVKLQHLLNYSSGLPMGAAQSDTAALTELKKVTKLTAAPGTTYLYNYSNVYLQRKIIERVAKMDYPSFVRKHIFRPLGLTKAKIDLPSSSALMARAFNSAFLETPYTTASSGWIKINLADLLKWTEALGHDQLLHKNSLQLLSRSLPNGESSLGKMTFNGGEMTWHQHHGSNHDYEALITNEPSSKSIIILQTNSQQFKVKAITSAILDILNDRPYQVPKKSLYLDLREKVLQDFAEGMRFYEEAVRHRSDRYDLGFLIGDLINTGKYLMRRQHFRDAADLLLMGTVQQNIPPKDLSFAYQLIAECYQKIGLKVLCIHYLEHAQQLDPENQSITAKLKDLVLLDK